MGKLNIAHHKSYHPYRRDNIERVRRDEEEARQKEAKEEGRMMLADSEARIDLLRDRAGTSGSSRKKRKQDDTVELTAGGFAEPAKLPTTDGHINLFQDLELSSIAARITASKKVAPAETEKGVPLTPAPKDLKPWYSERNKEKVEEADDERRKRDTARKSIHDPLTSITKQLASRSAPSPPRAQRRHSNLVSSIKAEPPQVQARITRESSERERALALIQRRKRELEGSMTPSTVNGERDEGYGDMYNKKAVEEAHRERERRWEAGHRGWGDEDQRFRNNGGRRQW